MYEYQASVLKVTDGDTVHLEVDLGFDVKRRDSFRLNGINAPEVSTPEGRAAKEWMVSLLPVGTVVTLHTVKDHREKYGRYLAVLLLPSDPVLNINDEIVKEGHAVVYAGGKR